MDHQARIKDYGTVQWTDKFCTGKVQIPTRRIQFKLESNRFSSHYKVYQTEWIKRNGSNRIITTNRSHLFNMYTIKQVLY